MDEKYRNSIRVGDIDISYYRKGNGNKAILLLHGNSEDASVFEEYFKTVNNNYKTYAIDLRGHGKTPSGKDEFTIKNMAIDIMRFIHQKPFKKVSIVGYSDGANVAMYLAKIAPELIDKLVLISGNLFVKALDKSFYNKIKWMYKVLKPFSFISAKAKRITSRLALMLDNIGVYPDDLNKYTFPALVIDAEDDLIDKYHTSLIARSIPDSKRITIQGTNHMNIIKDPKLFTAINSFISD